MKPETQRVLIIGASAAAACALISGAAYIAMVDDLPTPPKPGGGPGLPPPQTSAAPPPPPGIHPQAARVLAAARKLVPQAWGTAEWDRMMGGRINAAGKFPGQWKYFSDGYGTTCGVTVAVVLEDAGGPPGLINRAAPGGSGFGIGKHIERLHLGSKALGLRRDGKEAADLQPGDIYCSHRDGAKPGIDPSHVGIVLERNGENLVTADGGQTGADGRQCAKICKRRLIGDRLTNLETGSGATVKWRITWAPRAVA